jgi:hypothetical protein
MGVGHGVRLYAYPKIGIALAQESGEIIIEPESGYSTS